MTTIFRKVLLVNSCAVEEDDGNFDENEEDNQLHREMEEKQ